MKGSKRVLKSFVIELRNNLKLGASFDSREVHEVIWFDEDLYSLYDDYFGYEKRHTPTIITRCLMTIKDDAIFKSAFIFEKRKNKMFLIPRVDLVEIENQIKGCFEITLPGGKKEIVNFIGIEMADAEKLIKYVTRISKRGL